MTARPPPQTPIVRVRTALLLIGVVVLAHVLALHSLSESIPSTSGQLATRAFSTRAVPAEPPANPPTALPRRPVTRVPKPQPPTAPVPAARPEAEAVLSAATRSPESLEQPVAPPLSLPDALADSPVVEAEPAPPAFASETAPAPALAPAPATADVAATAAAPSPAASETVIEQPAPDSPAPFIAAQAATPTQALAIPGSIGLSFDAVGKRGRLEYKAMGKLTWIQDGSHYDMRMEMGDWLLGKRVLSSTGDITASGLAPTRFSDKFRSERAAHFDRTLGRITFSANTAPATLLPGAQDQLSIFAQMAAMVGGDPLAFPIGTTVTIQTAGPRDAEPWVFAVEREEMLYLPGGHVPALKLVRLPNKDYGQKVELWLAPELGFLPARIKVTFANGDYVDQQWASSRTP